MIETERQRILDSFLETGRAPAASPLWRQLAEARWIVLDSSGGVGMAHPFSGVETDFVVESGERRWFANCFWDALAVSAMVRARLGLDTVIRTHCGYSGQPMELAVGEEGPLPGEARIHFAVPLRDWWNDIVFT
ncbi:MAG: hypothetical protein HY821_11405 [Acidobacteria bacterium]|nr:hypothetical protein [Acidobacteriota bacterium]